MGRGTVSRESYANLVESLNQAHEREADLRRAATSNATSIRNITADRDALLAERRELVEERDRYKRKYDAEYELAHRLYINEMATKATLSDLGLELDKDSKNAVGDVL